MWNLHPETKLGAEASYHGMINRYLPEGLDTSIDFIIEAGSRDCADAIRLYRRLNKKVYAFECNPDALQICKNNLELNKISDNEVEIIPKALHKKNGDIDFYCTIDTPHPPSHVAKDHINYISINGARANIGTSSIHPFKEDWLKVHTSLKTTVECVTLDNFIQSAKKENTKYILCMDLQGAEFYALQGAEKYLKNCQFIIAEGCISQYQAPKECGGESIKFFLKNKGFTHINSHESGDFVFLNQDLL